MKTHKLSEPRVRTQTLAIKIRKVAEKLPLDEYVLPQDFASAHNYSVETVKEQARKQGCTIVLAQVGSRGICVIVNPQVVARYANKKA